MNARQALAGPAVQGQVAIQAISPQTINAIMGKIPVKRDEIAFWIAHKTNQLEVVYPHTTSQDKHRILTMCLPLGMVPSEEECNTWAIIFACVYSSMHGTPH